MRFGFNSGMLRQATRTAATATLLFGLSLISLAILIFYKPELIAYFIAGLLLLAGMSVVGYAFRLFLISGFGPNGSGEDAARRNVRIRIEDRDDNSI